MANCWRFSFQLLPLSTKVIFYQKFGLELWNSFQLSLDFTAQHKLGEMGFSEAEIEILDEKMKLLTLVALAENSPDVLYR